MTDHAALAAHVKDLLAQASAGVDQLIVLDLTNIAEPAPVAPAEAPAAVAAAGDEHPGLADEPAFYDWLRNNDLLGPTISATEFRGCSAITRAAANARWGVSWTAYAMATAYLETAHQMIPVREAYWLSDSAANAYFRRMYDIQGQRPEVAKTLGNLTPGDGVAYCGRGYVQLTGRKNYTHAAAKIGVDLVGHPERALEPEVAASVMIGGMREGWFTSRDIDDDLPAAGPAARAQFVASRDIINGHDREGDVADYALDFQTALLAGKWRF